MELWEIKDKLKETMSHEISLFTSYKKEFNKMKNFIEEKEWARLQETMGILQNLSDEIARTDSARDSLYGDLCRLTNSNKEDSFYSVVSKIEKCEGMTDIYRMVKYEANSIKVLNKGFSLFLQTRKNLIKGIMEELAPHRKGTMYNRKGVSLQGGNSSSFILNKHL